MEFCLLIENEFVSRKITSSVGAVGVSSAAGSSAMQMSGMDTISVPSSRVDDNGMIVESTPDGEWTYDPNEPRYCICNQVSYGDMVACDNDVVSRWRCEEGRSWSLIVLFLAMAYLFFHSVRSSGSTILAWA